ncbi:MAG: cell wall metabolism sensor histidine kinase WalK [Chloroflexales bacterium]|nr:cell wall metabolism sensor histidine kinase WalK [Chloroflexales bacterium]
MVFDPQRRAAARPHAPGWVWLGLGVGLSIALLLGIAWVQAPNSELVLLLSALLATGLASAAIGLAGVRWLRRGVVRIWLQVTLTYLFGVVVALCNILVTAQLMFLSTQDLPLLALLTLIAAVIATGLGAALAHVFAQRVSALHCSAEAIATGDLTVRVAVVGDDELAALARTFNHMADQLATGAAERARQEQLRRELIVAISHDLRTPLASLRAMTEALADGVVDDAATTTRYYATMRAQIGQLTELIEDLFSLSRLDAGVAELELQPTEVGPLIDDVLAGHSPQAVAKGVRLEAQVAHGVGPALLAPQQITRVLDNLLVNALRHTPPGGCIAVNAAALPGEAQIAIEVADTGEGIAPEDLPHVFERFYRGEKSRSRASGGAGLGLTIARGIVEAHGGTITIASAPGEGTRVRFTLPRVKRG